MKRKLNLGLMALIAVLGLSFTSGSVAHAHVANLEEIVSFGPFPSIPLPFPLPPSLDPKGSGDGL